LFAISPRIIPLSVGGDGRISARDNHHTMRNNPR
jgi:hypothetical protein